MSAPAAHLSATLTDDLETHVDAISMGLRALALLLVREREALTGRVRPEVLDNIAIDKQAAVANVGGLYGLLRDSLEACSEGGTRFSDSVASLKLAHPHLAARVDELVALTRECQLANEENGVLVNARLNGTRGALEALKDAGYGSGSDSRGTYGPVGASLGALAGDRLGPRLRRHVRGAVTPGGVMPGAFPDRPYARASRARARPTRLPGRVHPLPPHR